MYINYEYYRVFLLRRAMRQSDEGGGAAAKQPAEPDPRDQNAGGGAWLHALFPDEPRPDPDAGGRGALPPHPRGLCRDRGRGGRCHAEPDARARERVSPRARARCAVCCCRCCGSSVRAIRACICASATIPRRRPSPPCMRRRRISPWSRRPPRSPSLTQTRVRPIQEVPVCAPEFSVLLDRTVTLADLAAHPLITLGAGTTSHDFYAAVFARRGVPFQPVIEAATADQIIPMAEAGLGVGIVPQDFIRTSDRVRTIELTSRCRRVRSASSNARAIRSASPPGSWSGCCWRGPPAPEQCACGEVRRADFVDSK